MSKDFEPKIGENPGSEDRVTEDLEKLNWLIGLAAKELEELDPAHELLKFARKGEISEEDNLSLTSDFFSRFGGIAMPNNPDAKFMFKVADGFYSALNKEIERLRSENK